MDQPGPAGPLPSNVKLAAALFVVYGVAVVLNAAGMQGTGSWVAPGDFPKALIRLVVTGVIAWGLLHRARWAWWLGLALAAAWLIAGALTALVVEHGDVYWLRPSGFQIFLVVSLLCLGLSLVLLLSPSARGAFRRPPA
jgi:hypothetical protein